MLPTWVKVTKSRFNKIRSMITKSKKSGLKTSIGNKKITLHDTEKLVDGIIRGKINKSEARKMYNDIDANVMKNYGLQII